MVRILMISKTDGTVCGIGEYGRALAASMPVKLDIVKEIPDTVDGYNGVIVQWDYSFFPIEALAQLTDICTNNGTPLLIIMHTYLKPDGAWNFGYGHVHVRDFYTALTGAKIVVHNSYIAEMLKNDASYLSTSVIPLACPAPQSLPVPKNERLKIGSFGFCVPWKGHEALVRLAKARPDIDVELFSAVKADWPASVKFAAKLDASADGLSNFTHHTEYLPIDEAVHGLSQCDLIIMAYEPKADVGASAAIRTAMSSGRHVVVTPVPFTKDFTGVLHTIPDGSVASMESAIAAYLAGEIGVEKQIQFLLENNTTSVGTKMLSLMFRNNLDTLRAIHPHPDFIYDDPVQARRIEWLRDNVRKPFAEVGCACGFITEYLGGGMGLDIDDVRLEVAKQTRKGCEFINSPAETLPEAVQGWDVLYPDILEHVPMSTAQAAIRAALARNCRVLITMPLPEGIYGPNPEHLWLPTPENLKLLYSGISTSIHQETDNTFYYAILGD